MKWLGTKRILIKSIVLPGNFAATKAAPRIRELATSVREHGVIQAPVVEKETMRLVAGHDRIAALLALKEKHVEVRFVECDEREFRRMQIAENLHRRSGDDHDAMVAEYAKLEEGALTQEAKVGQVDPPARQTQRVNEAVNKNTAAALGKTVEAVKSARKRAARREREEDHPEPEGPRAAPLPELTEEMAGGKIDLPPGFKAFDLDVSLASRSVIDETAKWLGDWDKTLRDIVRELTEMEKRGNYAVAGAHLQRIREQVQNAGHAVRDAIPASLCFYCKAQPASTPNCPACGGTGVVGRHGGDNVPPELKLGGDKARVAVDGKFVLVGAVANAVEAVKEKPAKRGGVRVVAVDESGNEMDVPLDDVPPDDGEELAF